ncbi:type II secretory pathway pseudopilin PulG [Priestia megaterium]
MIIAFEILKIVVGLLIGFMLGSYLPSYFKQKGKNLATKEDIKEITTLQEEAKKDFQTALEEHKSALSAELEGLKHQQNKLLKDYELYTVKRFEYYPEFYKEIQWSFANVTNLRGVRTTIKFEKLTKTEIEVFMKEKQFMETERQQILAYWDDNKKSAKDILESRLGKIEYNEAQQSYYDANNCFLLYKLFFSPEVIKIGDKLLPTIRKLLVNYNPDLIFGDARPINEENEKLIKDIESLRDDLFKQMEKELSNSNKPKDEDSSS